MSEIEKLYEKAGVKKQIPKICSDNELYCKECKAHIEDAMPYCKNADYPPFTAEKQLKILEFILIRNIDIRMINTSNSHKYYISSFGNVSILSDKLSVTIASFINNLWQDLSDTEKAEIKRILE